MAFPTTGASAADTGALVFLLLLFVLYLFMQFARLRKRLSPQTAEFVQHRYQQLVANNLLLAVGVYALAGFAFGFKGLLSACPVVGRSIFLLHFTGILLFMALLALVWYISFRSLGRWFTPRIQPWRHVLARVKFNLVILIPWLILSLLEDLAQQVASPYLEAYSASPVFDIIVFLLFVLLFALLGPRLMVWLWDCRPLADSSLVEDIRAFLREQSVRVRGIYSWNALNKSMVTAGVVGVFAPARYLLITPALMRLLDPGEILAVISHEVGHIKKRHLPLYFLFFLGFGVASSLLYSGMMRLIAGSPRLLSLFISAQGTLDSDMIQFAWLAVMLLAFLLYFRFVFGYFMRHFERQADLFCFTSGPDPDLLIAAFSKLGGRVAGKEGNNWHHFSISQRVAFLRQCQEEPRRIRRHEKGLNLRLAGFVLLLVLLAFLSGRAWQDPPQLLPAQLKQAFVLKSGRNPESPAFWLAMAQFMHQDADWQAAVEAYERVLEAQPENTDALNGLAWLLVTADDQTFHDPPRALRLAERACARSRESHVWDTLAETLYANGRFAEAVEAAETALELTDGDRSYYQDQLTKMKKALAGQ